MINLPLIRFLVLVFSLLGSLKALSDEGPVGFLWYNLPNSQEQAPTQKGVPFSSLSYTERDKVLHFYTMEALHKARQTKSLKDMHTFLLMQDYWMNEASQFSNLFQKTLIAYPQFDYTVTHPTSSLGTKMLDELRIEKRNRVIRALAKTHGILFFYRGNNAFDNQQIPIIRDFCTRFGLYLIPVSVDGVLSPALEHSEHDQGQANRLQVRYFPAVLLVDPRQQKTLPVAYGFTTQDLLEKRLFQVATHFQGDTL